MENNKIIIGIDYDGTITDSLDILRHINHVFRMDIKPWEATSYDFNSLYMQKIDWTDKPYGTHTLSYYYKYSPWRTYAAEVIDYLMEQPDVELYIISARGEEGAKAAEVMCEKHLKRMPNLLFPGGDEEKIKEIKKLGCDIYIEDAPRNIHALTFAGINVIIQGQPYNLFMKNGGFGWYANSWLEIISMIDHYRNRVKANRL